MRKVELIYDTDCPNVEAARAPSVVEIVGKAVPAFVEEGSRKRSKAALTLHLSTRSIIDVDH